MPETPQLEGFLSLSLSLCVHTGAAAYNTIAVLWSVPEGIGAN